MLKIYKPNIPTEREKRDMLIHKEIRDRLIEKIAGFLKAHPYTRLETISKELKIKQWMVEKLVPEIRKDMTHNSQLSLEARVQALLLEDENIHAFDVDKGYYLYHINNIKQETGATKKTLQKIIYNFKRKQSETAERKVLDNIFNLKYFHRGNVKVDALAKTFKIWPEQVEFILKKNGLDKCVLQGVAKVAQDKNTTPEIVGHIYLATKLPYFQNPNGTANTVRIAAIYKLNINFVDGVCKRLETPELIYA